MNASKHFLFAGRLIVLLIASISVLGLAPPGSAQTGFVIPGTLLSETIYPGDTLSLAYQVSIANPDSIPATILMSSPTMLVSLGCPDGSSQTITVTAPDLSISIPALDSSWYPLVAVYQGTAIVPPTLCGGQGAVEKSVTFTATPTTTCNANSAQGCCKTPCSRFHHKHNQNPPSPDNNACKPPTQCTSGQTGGCCKT
jgi:hypothetical protein